MTFSSEASRVGPFFGSTAKIPLTLIRKQAAMGNQILNRRELCKQVGQEKPVALDPAAEATPGKKEGRGKAPATPKAKIGYISNVTDRCVSVANRSNGPCPASRSMY